MGFSHFTKFFWVGQILSLFLREEEVDSGGFRVGLFNPGRFASSYGSQKEKTFLGRG
jgi:hypothetical protein